ncbi:lipopolysaccharide assembly protein LapA domain-containing protein [Lacticaseibacillus nasuensis]|jgi:uncharacterized integral membrane protein|uniref:Lipopolysaccharide assembly protein A domain-containing protein n=1 Tax=Lacticaseibacillus nasuensis JCM 17158 TaxID=1291734 RepID=A0A0R1JPL0_9LACO|nr:lipopolysaccharide assembly protein LapA domain-containing protein [Lacticaseibacillus nasuensis]KRK73262.1 hypothetical protein FD02_GL001119 [Lacticaseibacillus nasuensis JCM 17158]MCX2454814.1 lipopolysaccharide assembly protein LapA domain-containing protein [Lacticaseibacillus nasuensis]
MKNQQRLIVGLVLALVLIVFALLNRQPVAVNFFGATFSWPLIIIIVVAVIIGAVIALLVATSSRVATKKQLAALTADNQRLTAERDKMIAAATAKAEAKVKALEQQLAQTQASAKP